MRTRYSSNLPVESPPNPSTSNPKRRNRRRSNQPFILEESPIDTMADQRTMAELLRAPPRVMQKTTNLHNKISNFQQRFDESFHKAWDRYKDLLRACPYHGFTEFYQLDTFYNALNPADQNSLNSAAGGNLLERRTQYVLTIIENKSKCLTTDGNTFPKLRDNIQGYVAAAAVNYNQGNSIYRAPGMANQIRPPGFAQPNVQNNQNRFGQPQGYNRGNNFNQEQSYQAPTQQNQVFPLRSGSRPRNTIANPKGELKAITTRSGIVLDGPSVPIPPPFINPEEDECASINLMPLSVWKRLGLPKIISTHMTLKLANRAICTPARIARDVFVLVSKFTFPADFVIVDYESDPRVPLILGIPFLRTARALIDVHGEEMILHDGDERLTLNMSHDTSRIHQSGNPTFPSHPKLTSPEVEDDVFDPDHMLKPLFPSPIPVEDINSFLEKSETSLTYLDISFPEFETFIIHTKETNSGSTTTHVDYSLPKYDSFLFEIDPDQGKLTSVVMKDNLAKPRVHVPNVLTTHPTLMLDYDFIPSDNSLPEFETFYFDIEEKNSGSITIHADISLSILECFNFGDKLDPCELTSIVDFEIHENIPSATNVNLPPEEDHSPLFAYVGWIFLSFLTYPVVPPYLFSFENKDTIFDLGISNYHFSSLLPNVSHRGETFMKFNVYQKLLNESPMEIFSSSCSLMEQ
nr:reverse transcriptase domain-containing protein [Tanacetum cinerariifolium]